jgi:diguanylate cyclase (GGDEF)-like protein
VQVGASVGVSCLPADSDDSDVLIRFADEAMYQAKANGRNQIFEHSK